MTKARRYRGYPYAPKVFVDYLSTQLPRETVWVTTEMPSDRKGKMVVTVTTVPAGDVLGAATRHHSYVLSWRRLVFQCAGDSEVAVGELCEQVRDLVFWSWQEHVCYGTDIVGEPGRISLPDEPVPRFQTTIDTLWREGYPAPAAAR